MHTEGCVLLQVEGDVQQGGVHSSTGSAEIEDVILGLLADIVGAVGSHQPFMEVCTIHFRCVLDRFAVNALIGQIQCTMLPVLYAHHTLFESPLVSDKD